MCNSTPYSADMRRLIDQRHRANTARGELLQLIADGILSPWEALVAAATAGEDPLLRLRLDQLVTAGPGVGQARAEQITGQVTRVLATTEAHTPTGRVTIGYILDEQARGKRLLAVLDAFVSHGLIREVEDLPVWTGFPFTPCPVDAKEKER